MLLTTARTGNAVTLIVSSDFFPPYIIFQCVNLVWDVATDSRKGAEGAGAGAENLR